MKKVTFYGLPEKVKFCKLCLMSNQKPNSAQEFKHKLYDKIDDLHYYTTYMKFGLGRATYDASQEIRNKHLTRGEGQELVMRFDGEFPDRYFDEVMEYLDINPVLFKGELLDRFRSPHLWGKDSNGKWKLRYNVTGKGIDQLNLR